MQRPPGVAGNRGPYVREPIYFYASGAEATAPEHALIARVSVAVVRRSSTDVEHAA